MPTLDTKTLIRLYRDEGLTLAEIGKRYGMTRQAVHQGQRHAIAGPANR